MTPTPQELWSAYERRRVACQARDKARAACPSTPLRKSASEKAQAKRKALRAAMYEAECEADTARDAWARTSRSAALAWLSPMLEPMRAKAQEALPRFSRSQAFGAALLGVLPLDLDYPLTFAAKVEVDWAQLPTAVRIFRAPWEDDLARSLSNANANGFGWEVVGMNPTGGLENWGNIEARREVKREWVLSVQVRFATSHVALEQAMDKVGACAWGILHALAGMDLPSEYVLAEAMIDLANLAVGKIEPQEARELARLEAAYPDAKTSRIWASATTPARSWLCRARRCCGCPWCAWMGRGSDERGDEHRCVA